MSATHYIYHRVAKNFQGNTLYPLNQLKDVYPVIYERQLSKYEGREHVLKQRIPLFDNCLWNDVLFFSAVNPAAVFEERRKAGWPDMEQQRYFKIDPRLLDQSKLGVFLFQPSADPRDYLRDNFAEYTYEDLPKYALVPEETKEYFRHEFEAGEPHIKLFWRYIPHILYNGSIDISTTEIITVS